MLIFCVNLQNPEEDVTFDTIPNVKKEHEVNVGKSRQILFLGGCLLVCWFGNVFRPGFHHSSSAANFTLCGANY